MAQLLKKISVISLVTALGAAVGFGASYSQEPLWQSSAQFEAPKALELGNYFSLFSTYHFLKGDLPQQSNEQATIKYVYDEFKRNLTSEDLLREFLTQQEVIKLIAQAERKSVNVVITQILSQFTFKNDQLSLTLGIPEQAQQLLTEYITFTNNKTRQTLNDELIWKWRDLFGLVKNAAEIKLGAIQQGEQVVSQDWQGKLALMRAVSPLDNKLVAYRLLKSPTLPLEPVSPARTLWAVIGGAIGLLLGLMLMCTLYCTPERHTENVEQN